MGKAPRWRLEWIDGLPDWDDGRFGFRRSYKGFYLKLGHGQALKFWNPVIHA